MKLELTVMPDNKNEIVSLKNDELIVKIIVNGTNTISNLEIVKFLSEALNVKKRDIKIFDNKINNSKIIELPDSVKGQIK